MALAACFRTRASVALARLAPFATIQQRSAQTIAAANEESVFCTNVTGLRGNSPLVLGLVDHFQHHVAHVGYFQPIGADSLRLDDGPPVPKHVAVMQRQFGIKDPAETMYGVLENEAQDLVLKGRSDELIEKIYNKYTAYRKNKDMVVIEGATVEGIGRHVEWNGRLAAELDASVLMVMDLNRDRIPSEHEILNRALIHKAALSAERADVMGLVLNKLPLGLIPDMESALKQRLKEEGLPLFGCLPFDRFIGSARLNEIQSILGARQVHGPAASIDSDATGIMICSQSIGQFLEKLEALRKIRRVEGQTFFRPLVLTSKDRTDVLLGLSAAHAAAAGPSLAGLVLCDAHMCETPPVAAAVMRHYEAAGLPVLEVPLGVFESARRATSVNPGILPSSSAKARHAAELFRRHIDAELLASALRIPRRARLTPKAFLHQVHDACRARPQRIVLPEAHDPRVLAAAAEATAKGLARVVLLGREAEVRALATKLGLDISGCEVVDVAGEEMAASPREQATQGEGAFAPSSAGVDAAMRGQGDAAAHAGARLSLASPSSPRAPSSSAPSLHSKYTQLLLSRRAHKGLTLASALDQMQDPNVVGTLMVACGDADGMVSGATCTTAATIRPALQLLKASHRLVSSLFFMCLPDRVLAYGDCAVNPDPSAEQLAQIAESAAETTRAFGIEPRVAMLSYSTLGSGSGPAVDKVAAAVEKLQAQRPDLMVEGPIQYDAAVDSTIAAAKVKKASEVAGRATVCVFPDLNTGNNTYKAVQQSTGALAVGPLMMGLQRPVNDLSRGCTVADIVNTIACTAVQAIGLKDANAAAEGEKSDASQG